MSGSPLVEHLGVASAVLEEIDLSGDTTIEVQRTHTRYRIAGAGPFTITLNPAADAKGCLLYFKRMSSETGVITVAAQAGDFIDADTSITLEPGDSITLVSDGANTFEKISEGRLTAVRSVSAGTQSIAVSTLTDISGLSLALSADKSYEVKSFIAISVDPNQLVRFSLSFPAMKTATARWRYSRDVDNNSIERTGVVTNLGSGSITLSVDYTTGTLDQQPIQLDGIFLVSTSGTMQVAAAIGNVAVPALHILPGSYIKATQL